MSENISHEEEKIGREPAAINLKKIEESTQALQNSVRDFVKSSSETLNSLSTVISEDTVAKLKIFLEKADAGARRLSGDGELLTRLQEQNFKKFLSELSYFQSGLESGINGKIDDLNDFMHTMFGEIKTAFMNLSEGMNAETDGLLVGITGDLKQIRSDMNDLSGQLGTINVLAKERSESCLKKIAGFTDASEKSIANKIDILRNENATAEFVKSTYEQTTFNLRNEINLLKSGLNQQLHQLLGKTATQDEIKFLCEEILRTYKDNGTETGILKKYLKDIKVSADSGAETVDLIKEMVKALSDSGLEETADKVDVIYENIAFLNSWANSSDLLGQNLTTFKEKLDKDLEQTSQRIMLLAKTVSSIDFEKYHAELEEAVRCSSEKTAVLASGVENLREEINSENVALEEFKAGLSGDLSQTAEKVDVIYENMNTLNASAQVQDGLVKNFEEFKTDVSQNLNETAEKVDVIYENMNTLNASAQVQDGLVKNFEEFKTDVSQNLNETAEKVDVIYENMNTLNASAQVQDGLVKNFEEFKTDVSQNLNETAEKVDVIYENMNTLNASAQVQDGLVKNFEEFKTDVSQNLNETAEKVDVIYENMNTLNASAQTQDVLVKNFEEFKTDVSQNLNETAEKVDVIYENMNTLNASAQTQDVLVKNFEEFKTDVSQNLNETAEKVDIIYDTMTFLNENAQLQGLYAEEFTEIKDKLDLTEQNNREILQRLNDFDKKDTDPELLNGIYSLVTDISRKNSVLAKSAAEISENFEAVSDSFSNTSDSVSSLVDKVSGSVAGISNSVEVLKKSVSVLTEKVENTSFSLVDNISGINGVIKNTDQNVSDGFTYISEVSTDTNAKITAVTENLSFLNDKIKIIDSVAENLSKLADEVKAGNNNEDWADAVAFGIETLAANIDDGTNVSRTINEKLSKIEDDITGISLRTNKLILNSDKTDKEMQKHIGNLQNIIENLENRTESSEIKDLKNSLYSIFEQTRENAVSGQILTEAFSYLAEWIDNAGSSINSISEAVSDVKNEVKTETLNGINELKTLIGEEFSKNTKMDDAVAEINSKFSEIPKQEAFDKILTALKLVVRLIDEKDQENAKKFDNISGLLRKMKMTQRGADSAVALKREIGDKVDKVLELMESTGSNAPGENVVSPAMTGFDGAEIIKKFETETAVVTEKISELNNRFNEFDKRLSSLENGISRLISYLEEDDDDEY
ncbi:MAG: hypothetical protein ACI4CY_07020 [Candidatus Gastranaerophilaceae bacterium]